MKIIWLGHGSFRIELADQVLLIDPWLDGNPLFPNDRRAEALQGVTAIFLTHGHFDHTDGIAAIAAETGAPVFGMVELAGILEAQGLKATGFNIGGSVQAGAVTASMVPATHSSSIMVKERLVYAGAPNGFVFAAGDESLYVSGDTGLCADMAWVGGYHKPKVGILSAGGHFTMDMQMAAYACQTYFDFETVVPCHFKTFPLLEQSADALAQALPNVNVVEPEVMTAIEA